MLKQYNIQLDVKKITHAMCAVNNEIIKPHSKWEWNITVSETSVVEIHFFGSDNVPLLRIDSFLINFWLGDIQYENNKIKFIPGLDFYKKYNTKDKEGRLNSLGPGPSDSALDRNVGRSCHQDLVSEINVLINEKRRTTVKSALN